MIKKSLLVVVAALLTSLALSAQASAATGFERAGAFAEAFPDGQPAHQKRIAVNYSSGDVYVTDQVNDQIAVYRPNGTGADPLTTFAADVTDPFGIAIDQDNGDVYVSDDDEVAKYTSDGAATPTFTRDLAFVSPGVTGPLSFDQANDELLVGDRATNTVRRYSTAGVAGDTFDGSAGAGSPGAFAGIQDLAADSSGDIVVVDSTGDPALGSGTSRVERFDSAGQWEDTIGPVAGAATVGIRPEGDEVVVSGNQDAVNRNEAPTVQRFSSDGASLTPVAVDSSALYSTVTGIASQSGPTGQLFVATDVDAAWAGAFGLVSVQVYDPFEMQPPSISDEKAEPGERTARMTANINPNRDAATWRIQYGLTTAYGNETPATSIPSGASPVSVARFIGDLAPGQTHHYRFVATNSGGTTEGPDRTLTTRPAGTPPPETGGDGVPRPPGANPDGRAYEMVSPPDKGGIDITVTNSRTRAAADGNSVTFVSTGAFAGVEGTGQVAQYVGERTAGGWRTRGISPPNKTGLFQHATSPTFYAFSDDLSLAVFRGGEPRQDPAAPPETNNLYVRSDATDNFRLVTPVAPSGADYGYQPFYAAHSADFSHVLFESSAALLPDAPDDGLVKLYENVGGTVRLVAREDGVNGAPMSGGSVAGAPAAGGGFGYTNIDVSDAISRDGRVAVFTTGTDFPSQDYAGQLYLRVDGEQTIHVNASRRSAPDPNGTQDVTFQGMSDDGDRVLFRTSEQLTDEDTNGVGSAGDDLYQYQRSTDQLTLLSGGYGLPADTASGFNQVLGSSADGRSIYFVANGRVTPGIAGDAGARIYMWRNGDIEDVGRYVVEDLSPFSVPQFGRSVRVSSDGDRLLFLGTPTDDDASAPGGKQVWAHDASEGQTRCVSCPADGSAPTQNARLDQKSAGVAAGQVNYLPRLMSDDGQRIVFATAEALSDDDTNGKLDVYQYDWDSQGQALVSGGTGDDHSYVADMTADGRDVFFLSRQRLSAWDKDQNYDLYDARRGGGLPEPIPAPGPCGGDACQGPANGSAPDNGTPPSANATPPGGAPPRAQLSVAKLTSGQRRTLAKTGKATMTFKVNRPGRLGIRGVARIRGKRRTVFSAAKRVSKASRVRIRMSLSRAARAQLRRTGRLSVAMRVSFTGTSTRSQTLNLRRAKPKGKAASVSPHSRATTTSEAR